MSEIIELVSRVAPVITLLTAKGENNVVIGGSVALLAHGLSAKSPQDVDLILYQPTARQCMLLNTDFEEANAKIQAVPYSGHKVYKTKSMGVDVDVILEWENQQPEVLLYIQGSVNKFFGGRYPVQPIGAILDAKQRYARVKDYVQIRDLAKDNFIDRLDYLATKKELCSFIQS